MSQPGTNILLPREIRHHGVSQFQLDLPVKGIDQIILSLEVRKQSSLGDPSSFRYLRRWGSGKTALRKYAGRGIEDRIALVFAFRARHRASLLLSVYSIIHRKYADGKQRWRTETI